MQVDNELRKKLDELYVKIRNERYGDPALKRQNQWRTLCIRKGRGGIPRAPNRSTPGCFMWDPNGCD